MVLPIGALEGRGFRCGRREKGVVTSGLEMYEFGFTGFLGVGSVPGVCELGHHQNPKVNRRLSFDVPTYPTHFRE